jgi:hypothetical protein
MVWTRTRDGRSSLWKRGYMNNYQWPDKALMKDPLVLVLEGIEWVSNQHFPTQELAGSATKVTDRGHGDSGPVTPTGGGSKTVRGLNPHQRDVDGIWREGKGRRVEEVKAMFLFKGTDDRQFELILVMGSGCPCIGHVNQTHTLQHDQVSVGSLVEVTA